MTNGLRAFKWVTKWLKVPYKVALSGLRVCYKGLQVDAKWITSWLHLGYEWVTSGLQVGYELVTSGQQAP